MVSKKIFLFLFIFLTAQSCKNNNKPKYDNEKLLINYLQKKQGLTIITEKSYVMAIMQIGICGACTEFNKTKIVEYISQSSNLSTKILILSDKNEKLQQYFLSNCGSDLILLTDNGVDITKYGLRYSKDLLLKIRNNTVYEYSFLEGK